MRVESYQIYDQDEVQGINTAEDLSNAEFILQKRLFRPHRPEAEEPGRLRHRRLAGDDRRRLHLHNVRRLSQALANEITRQRAWKRRGVLIGYDRRFLSDRAAEASAEVFAGNNIPVTLLSEDVPTPLVTYATALLKFRLRPGLHRQP